MRAARSQCSRVGAGGNKLRRPQADWLTGLWPLTLMGLPAGFRTDVITGAARDGGDCGGGF
ncbi:hypothetical protein LG003_21110 [Photorhabdus kleinii]|uniref:hypothetical protein n=1 Tax=Photorhabdus TaxID=29487 RepID=UPI0021D48C0A|nr:hypothetical protein [Photorhabdus kleinii]MCT8345273.1 hypothetical protein [Photorhabdus kleinii]